MSAPWPPLFDRVPDEPWTRAPIEGLATNYDTVERHGWYANLDTTVDEIAAWLGPGKILVDYSGGTGILIDRLLSTVPDAGYGIINADSSPKFLRLAYSKFRDNEAVAFRLIHYLKAERRLEWLDEVLGPTLVERGVDGIVSTNAVHLYYDLQDTFDAWARTLTDGGMVFVQSGNILSPGKGDDRWIIDDTVHAIARRAEHIVAQDDDYNAYRHVLDDETTMSAHRAMRDKYFLPVRPLAHYTEHLERAGFHIERVHREPIEADVNEWFEFLSVYHDGILGWLGGTEKIEGRPPNDADVTRRLGLMRRAMHETFGGSTTFMAEWTYITASKQRADR